MFSLAVNLLHSVEIVSLCKNKIHPIFWPVCKIAFLESSNGNSKHSSIFHTK